MADDLGRHKRWNRKSRHLIKLLSKTRVKSVRLAIMEELQHEITRAKESRLGKQIKRGAIGVSGWGKRVIAKGEAYAQRPARRNHTRATVGAYARQQAVEREKNRPAREAAKQARRDKRQTRKDQRATRRNQRQQARPEFHPGYGPRGLYAAIRNAGAQNRNGQMANGGNGTITRVSTPRAPRKPATQARPAANARASRAAGTTAKTPAARTSRSAPLPADTVRPARSARSSRTSKTG